MIQKLIRTLAVIIKRLALMSSLLLAGCQQTVSVSDYQEAPLQDPGILPEFVRTVETFRAADLHVRSPDCAIVWPVDLAESLDIEPWQSIAVEAAVARHARDVMNRVIDGGQRESLVRSRLLDLTNPQDVKRLEMATRCSHALMIRPVQIDDTFALVWSRSRVGLEIVLTDLHDPEDVLWSARHATQQSEGSLPITPVGFAAAVVSAGQLKADSQEIFISVANTVTRRIFATLPDMRTLPNF